MRLIAENGEGRGGRRWDQAHRRLLALGSSALLSACAIPADIDPRITVANIFGAHLEGRLPPPGLERPFPSLGSLPPRPEPIDRGALAALSEALAADRLSAAEPQGVGPARSIAAGPPAAPDLRLPRASTPPGATPSGATPAGATPPGVSPAGAALPEAVPAPPPAEFLGVPALPSPALLAPRRP